MRPSLYTKTIEIVCFACWLVGLFAPELRVLWAFPAGWGTGIIMLKWYVEYRRGPMEARGINLNGSDIPQDVKDKVDAAVKSLIDSGIIKEPRKCDDPHCKNCWGLGEDAPKI